MVIIGMRLLLITEILEEMAARIKVEMSPMNQ